MLGGSLTSPAIARLLQYLTLRPLSLQVQFNVNRVDNMVIQAIALLDTLDRDINTFVMRVREWYSWHFPELVKIVPDNYQYSRLALLIKDKSQLAEAALPGADNLRAMCPLMCKFGVALLVLVTRAG